MNVDNNNMSKYSFEIKEAARSLYIRRWLPKDIADELSIPVRTIYHWADVGDWPALLPVQSVEEAIARRIDILTSRDKKNEIEIKELESLIAQHCKLIAQKNKHAEKMNELNSINHSAKLNLDSNNSDEFSDNDGGNKKRRRRKNDISDLTEEILDAWANEHLFEYQLHVRKNKHRDFRFILKSRQIGMTYYFAFEAFEDAVITGMDQVFFSASRAQAEIFKHYIVKIAENSFDVKLVGDSKIILSNGATLRFVSTNSNTSQGYNGNLYGDEVFWIPKFQRLHEVASAMTTQARFRTTYFSTPSSKQHQAHGIWSGEDWKGEDAKRKAEKFPTLDDYRDGGRLCPDQIWRYAINIYDACKGGLDALVNIDRLKNRYSEHSFNMLFMCLFVDSKDAVFRLSDLMNCEVDPAIWSDVDMQSAHPCGNREVWAGFDPARSGDNSTFVLVLPPLVAIEKFRVIAVYYWQGLNFKYQAEQIKELTKRFNITHIGIDITGIGYGVYELVQAFAPRVVEPIRYSVDVKNQLVMKMMDLVNSKRIEWPRDAKDEVNGERAEINASFMSIRQTTTASGNMMTFVAERSETTGHADFFFALAHAVKKEPINHDGKRSSTWSFGNNEQKKAA